MSEILTAQETCCADHDHTDPEICNIARIMRDVTGATLGETNRTVIRPLSVEEIAQREADAAAFAEQQAAAEAEAAARQAEKEAIAARLGLSADELKTLLS